MELVAVLNAVSASKDNMHLVYELHQEVKSLVLRHYLAVLGDDTSEMMSSFDALQNYYIDDLSEGLLALELVQAMTGKEAYVQASNAMLNVDIKDYEDMCVDDACIYQEFFVQ